MMRLADVLAAHLKPGECACTRFGVKFCYIPGKGVRFVGKCTEEEMRRLKIL